MQKQHQNKHYTPSVKCMTKKRTFSNLWFLFFRANKHNKWSTKCTDVAHIHCIQWMWNVCVWAFHVWHSTCTQTLWSKWIVLDIHDKRPNSSIAHTYMQTKRTCSLLFLASTFFIVCLLQPPLTLNSTWSCTINDWVSAFLHAAFRLF